MKVTLIDYGAGNVTSVERALQRLGAASKRSIRRSALPAQKRCFCPVSAIMQRLSEHSTSAVCARLYSMPSGAAFLFSAFVWVCKRFTKPAMKRRNLED